jgi:alpha-ketoglutarate-dependent 2,4-dichlorophenoxyacetate dioxygenase
VSNMSILPVDPDRHANFVGVVTGINVGGSVSADEIDQMERGMDRFGILVFRDQRLTDEQQLAFTRRFGELEEASGDIQQGAQRRLNALVNDISNVDENNQRLSRNDRRRLINLSNRSWHTDSSYKATPAKYSLLSARILPTVPPTTEFADMRAAYDELAPNLKAMVKDLICEHSQFYSRSLLGYGREDFTETETRHFTPVPQRLVRRHPKTGRLSLYLASHAGAIVDMPKPEARVLLRELTEHATQRKFVYAHAWRPNDLVMWDNRVTMHRSMRYDGPDIRDMHRTTVADVAPTLMQAV